MKHIIYLILLTAICSHHVNGQGFYLDSDARLLLPVDTGLYIDGNVVLQGELTGGTLSLTGDLDLQDNDQIEKIRFLGSSGQNVDANTTTVNIDQIVVDMLEESAVVNFDITSVVVEESLSLENGIINTPSPESLMVTGAVTRSSGSGHVQGIYSQRSISESTPLLFPLGIENNYYELQVQDVPEGETVIIECITPDISDWDTYVQGTSILSLDEHVQWYVRTASNVEINVRMNYNGDENQFTVFNDSINNLIDGPPVVEPILAYLEGDTVFTGLEDSFSGSFSFGVLTTISSVPKLFAVGGTPEIKFTDVAIPNVFSPNATDFRSQTFRPFLTGSSVIRFRMVIYDANNKLVFDTGEKSDDVTLADEGWDGKLNNGSFANPGSYIYSIDIEYEGQNPDMSGPIVGHVLLIN